MSGCSAGDRLGRAVARERPSAPSSRGRGRSTTRDARVAEHVLPAGVAAAGRDEQAVLEPHEPARRHVRARRTGRASRHGSSGTSRKARRRNSRSPLMPPRPGRPARAAPPTATGSRPGASSPARASRDQAGHAGLASSAASPSRSSSRSWNARPSGAPNAASAAVDARVALGERRTDQQRALHGVRAALEPRDRRRHRSSPTGDVQGLPERPSPSASGGSGRARATRRSGSNPEVSSSRSARTARGRRRAAPASAPARSGSDEPTRARSVGQLERAGGAPRRSGLRSIRSSWISAIVCSSSSAAAARSIGGAVGAAGRPVPPEAEHRPQPLASRHDQPDHLVDREQRLRRYARHLVADAARGSESSVVVDPRADRQ